MELRLDLFVDKPGIAGSKPRKFDQFDYSGTDGNWSSRGEAHWIMKEDIHRRFKFLRVHDNNTKCSLGWATYSSGSDSMLLADSAEKANNSAQG